jgi:hypothetical protein
MATCSSSASRAIAAASWHLAAVQAQIGERQATPDAERFRARRPAAVVPAAAR